MNEYPNSIRKNMVNTEYPNSIREKEVNTEYPNSIRKNMVNTEYKVNIISLPQRRTNYVVKREESHNLKTIVASVLVATAIFSYFIGVTVAQKISFQQNTAVVATEALPDGFTLNITANPDWAFIETPDGKHVADYKGINARDLARGYQESGPTMEK